MEIPLRNMLNMPVIKLLFGRKVCNPECPSTVEMGWIMETEDEVKPYHLLGWIFSLLL